jgi:hypothetical protein
MSVHQRIKFPSNNQVFRIKSNVQLAFYGVLYSSAAITALLFLYVIKSAMGIDLIPGWSLFH